MFFRRVLAAAFTTFALTAPPVLADTARDARFFQGVEGQWRGPGEIVAGKYKGTKFICDFQGATPSKSTGMSLDGSCRVGLFTQKMSASVKRSGGTYKGAFLDGALGEGLDVIAGNVTDDRAVLTLKRKDLNGAMLVRQANANTLNVTVSVRVGEELVPVIGMSMNRVDGTATSSIK